jgi:dethiobiotin synthetase/adenosylmethionine--8-amino-7-oxononanoate aminotransferase
MELVECCTLVSCCSRALVRVVRRCNFSTAPADVTLVLTPKFDTKTGFSVLFDDSSPACSLLGNSVFASPLEVHFNICCHAKQLTGVLLPRSIATEGVFVYQVFQGNQDLEVLLHGHRYTSHAVGCHVTKVSLQTMGGLGTSDFAWSRIFASNVFIDKLGRDVLHGLLKQAPC